ncbi:MAG: SDR family oxidoreductase [Desulfarculaceae bacterium]|nr:SDR family oxidoreductase [Desulfarculaceae bacterium]MCF8071967.1 SDR family oxidoreductase [Desulfarculaceae bacterium]MCF8101484.1 SDR family oxidoreductase [Desulfarculaceae bacterium]MCF8115034.1 SDR family oxidoreductase [Desulfarculaceae bacterium]
MNKPAQSSLQLGTSLSGQVAVVTGGGQGIGRAIALRLAGEGARLVLGDVNLEGCHETAGLIAQAGGAPVKVLSCDVSREDQVAGLMHKAAGLEDRLDILVNNSGIAGPTALAEDISLEDWEATMAVNLRGVFLGCKHALPAMKKARRGSIVNISSISAKRPLLRRTPYAASKMAIIGYTRTLAAEAGEWGIRVNAVCPGAVAGPRQDQIIEALCRQTGQDGEELRRQKAAISPLKCLVDPDDVARVVAFLCGQGAKAMTGQDINVSAGVVVY